ncbi:hypothetical protein HMN09_00589900 [Mycena chlorophos]|uniref:Uncharacterized protein n=1 Tax=Mycena chlorophos TaxID=658473 RepID=A0A8H6T1T7_MYCCL|nr:hypothetical protein HMN09_00589900 [Mycena chlorophos]
MNGIPEYISRVGSHIGNHGFKVAALASIALVFRRIGRIWATLHGGTKRWSSSKIRGLSDEDFGPRCTVVELFAKSDSWLLLFPFGPIAPSPLSVSRYELPPPPNFPSFTLVLTRAAKPDNEVLTFPWTPIEYVPTRPKPKKVVIVEQLPAPATAPVDAKPNFVKRFLGYIKRFMAALKAKLTFTPHH